MSSRKQLNKFLCTAALLTLTMTDQLWLATNIYHEARGEGPKGWELVMTTTLCRVLNGNYPNTVYDVVWQPGQFSWTADGKSDRITEITTFYKILSFIREQEKHKLVVKEITHYHNTSVQPYWANKFKFVGKYGNHLAYREI